MPKGKYFDSHYVIDTIIKEHSDEYMAFVRANSGPTEYVHSEIAKLIRDSRLVVRVSKGEDSYSYNIHWKPSFCVLWQRK